MSVFPKIISIPCPVTADQAATGRSKRISSSLAKLAALEFGYDEEWILSGDDSGRQNRNAVRKEIQVSGNANRLGCGTLLKKCRVTSRKSKDNL